MKKLLAATDPSPEMVEAIKRKWQAEEGMEAATEKLKAARRELKAYKEAYKDAVREIGRIASAEVNNG